MTASTEREPITVSEQGLSTEQLGHLRRLEAMGNLPKNDWSGMQGRSTGQDDLGGYRFQLAYGAYALALTYRHRLPNAPGVFKPTFIRLIEKILLPEVWMYWRDVSRGGAIFNAHLSETYTEQWDPVVKDNIMYSAYVQSMTTMFNAMFDDDRYTTPGALSFDHWSFFWGGEPKHAPYDQNSLNEHLYWQMVETGYLGIACEPNCVFQICNQPAIIGFRMNDIATGSNIAEDVVAGYQQAWADFGRLDADGHYNMVLHEDSKALTPNFEGKPWIDAWCGALMNSWNRDFVRENYPRQIKDLVIPGPDGTLSVPTFAPAVVMGQNADSDSNDFGWVAVWASEMGDTATLDGLLSYADRFLNPTWNDGALYYPRNDQPTDSEGNNTQVEPMTGNVLLAYARLNVPDGLWSLYNEPWDASHHREPLVVEVSDDVDITRADFDRATKTLTVHVSQRAGRRAGGRIAVSNVADDCRLLIDGAESKSVRDGDNVVITCPEQGSHEVLITVPTWSA